MFYLVNIPRYIPVPLLKRDPRLSVISSLFDPYICVFVSVSDAPAAKPGTSGAIILISSGNN